MLIAGAGGHAREILFEWQLISNEPIIFFDDTSISGNQVYGEFPIINTLELAAQVFEKKPAFIIGVGKPSLRNALCLKLEQAGGVATTIISKTAVIGNRNVILGEGLNIMSGVIMTTDIIIGKGVLIHTHTSIHHDCQVGDFSEISPGCRILGKVQLGAFVSVGAGAVILPGIKVGDRAVIGAGAVVNKDVAAGQKVVGVPANPIIHRIQR